MRIARLIVPLLVGTTSIAAQHAVVSAERDVRAVQRQSAPKAHVGSAMAVLATLDQAQVLPPEGTRETNRVIQAVIQFQSAFTTGDDPAIRAFTFRALETRQGTRAESVMAHARVAGWTPELLDSLAAAEAQTPPETRQTLQAGLTRYNMSVEDFHRFMELVRTAQASLQKQGSDFQQVYAAHRKTMPGYVPSE